MEITDRPAVVVRIHDRRGYGIVVSAEPATVVNSGDTVVNDTDTVVNS